MSRSQSERAQRTGRAPVARAGDALASIAWTLRALERSLAPLVDLGVRLALARIFFVSAVIKLSNWENALALARDEYPVSWLDPGTAAVLGVVVELGGAIGLALGLGTRAAALALIALAAVIQVNYRALDQHLFWIVLLAWPLVRGPGPLALDPSLARGLAASAIPFAARVVGLLAQATRTLTPYLQLALRGWLAVSVLAAAGLAALSPDWFALGSAGAFASVTGVIAALLLAAGAATRVVALGWLIAAVVLGSGALTAAWYWVAALLLLVLHGPGPFSIDAWIAQALRRRFPRFADLPAEAIERLPHVVIVGAGFGGIACARSLATAPVRVTLIDRHNYHLFQPLLYQVATSALAPGDIAQPVRGIFREQPNVRVVLGDVTGIDTARRSVALKTGRPVPYDYLVLATGASHSYFGRDEWAPFAPGLKRVEDATEVRRRVLLAFERAEVAEDAEERASWLTFLVVGGGPTGVELAGAIAELARLGLEKEFRRFDPASARVILVQAGLRLLPAFPEPLSVLTRAALERLGVDVQLNSRVEAIDDEGVLINGRRMPARTVLWAAGVVASPAARWLGAEHDNAGRVKVGPDLCVPGVPNVFAIGDTALSTAWAGQAVPGLAPAAKQGGAYVARVIRARLLERPAPPPFRYAHMGSLATIGRKAAVADFGFVRLSGAPAWWLWGLVHVGFLLGVRNRVSVMLDWFWAYLTFKTSTRLITGMREAEPSAVPATQAAPIKPAGAAAIERPVTA